MDKIRLGFVPSHRYPYDEEWAVEMRRRSVEALSAVPGIEVIVPSVGCCTMGWCATTSGRAPPSTSLPSAACRGSSSAR